MAVETDAAANRQRDTRQCRSKFHYIDWLTKRNFHWIICFFLMALIGRKTPGTLQARPMLSGCGCSSLVDDLQDDKLSFYVYCVSCERALVKGGKRKVDNAKVEGHEQKGCV